MVAWSATGDYGYADEQIGPDRFRITYISPRLRADIDPDNSHGLEGERGRVDDLALWRAAQLAREKGYAAFVVEQDNRDIDVTIHRDRVYPAAPYPLLFGGPWHWRGGYWPYGYWTDSPGGYRESAVGRVKSELTVRMLRVRAANSLETSAILDRLRKQYGAARFPNAIYTN
jgi:hypothetical protein